MERSTVYCTNCRGTFVAELDLALDGNHQITCPMCFHVHYRVVRAGRVTEDRWLSSAGQLIVSNTYTTTTSTVSFTTISTAGTGSNLASSWINRSDIDLRR